jgi:protein disulfide-isomerase A6
MKPDWDELMNEFGDSKSVVVAEVDCTVEEGLCGGIGIQGYPTIKYWNAGASKDNANDYQGGRDLEALRSFVVENLQKLCSVADPADCSEKEVQYIESLKGKSSADIAAQLERLQGMADKKMKPELKRWVNQRLNILKQL